VELILRDAFFLPGFAIQVSLFTHSSTRVYYAADFPNRGTSKPSLSHTRPTHIAFPSRNARAHAFECHSEARME
jgi:hypothetical protein